MKLHIVHDASGKILAAADLTEDSGGPRPVPGRGHRELVLDVPAEHRGKSFLEICRSLRVDAKAKTLVAPRQRASTPRVGKKRK